MLNSKAIKTVRQYLDWSIRDLASKANISASYLGDIEAKRAEVTPEADKKIRQAFESDGIKDDHIFLLVTTLHDITKQARKNKQKSKGDKNKCNN